MKSLIAFSEDGQLLVNYTVFHEYLEEHGKHLTQEETLELLTDMVSEAITESEIGEDDDF